MTEYRRATLSGPGGEFTLTERELIGDRVESILTNVKGWYGGVGVDTEKTQRTLGHGLFPAVTRRTGRSVTVEGTLIFREDADRLIADRFLSGLLWDGDEGTLTVETGQFTLSSTVKLDGEIGHAYHGVSAIDVQIPLLAVDPFLYAEKQVYQVYPEGSGVGLVYPLFAGRTTQVVSLVSGLVSGDPTSAGVSSARFTTNKPSSTQIVNMAPVQSGRSYTVTEWAKADRSDSAFAVRYVLTGPGKTDVSGYITSPVTRTVTTSWSSYAVNVAIPDGYTAISLAAYPNHTAGSVTNAVQDIAVTVTNYVPGPLGFGRANPNTRGVVQNMGNATEYPVIRVVGDFPSGFRLTDSTGRVIEYPAPVRANSPVEVDNRAGAVYQNGLDQSYRLTRRDWFQIGAGSTNAFKITSFQPGDGYAEVIHRSTYI